MKNLKYKTSFASAPLQSVCNEEAKKVSKASLYELESLVPEEVRGSKNIDLLPVAFDLAIVGQRNKKGDLIDKETALAVYKQFIHRFQNLRHDRQRIIGHIVNAGFTDIDTHAKLTEDDLANRNVFNLSLAAVIYVLADKRVAQAILDSNDPLSDFYQKISNSWELAFDGYYILLGDDMDTGEVVSEEDQPLYEQYLRANDGSGYLPDGRSVNRVISIRYGDVMPLGAATTGFPAAFVQGTKAYVNEPRDTQTVEKEENEGANKKPEPQEAVAEEERGAELVKLFAEAFPNAKKQSQASTDIDSESAPIKTHSTESVKQSVATTNDSIIMDIAKLQEKLTKGESLASTEVQLVFDELQAKSEQFAKIQKEKEQAATNAENLQGKVDSLASELEETKNSYKKLQDQIAEQEAEASFNERMESLDEIYDLDDEMRQVVASEIRGLDDESYGTWFKKFEALAKYSKKDAKAEKEAKEKAEAEKKAEADKKGESKAEKNKKKESHASTEDNDGTGEDTSDDSFEVSALKQIFASTKKDAPVVSQSTAFAGKTWAEILDGQAEKAVN